VRVSSQPFLSYAQHGEDVVIWRALGHVPEPRYVDVGAADPSVDSVTRGLYENGWRGVHVEALREYAAALREARPEDVVVEAAAGAEPGELTFYRIVGTGLSTTVAEEAARAEARGFGVETATVPLRTLDDILEENVGEGRPIHVLKVDVEGAEELVLRGANLRRWRPWVVVVEATRPGSTERTEHRWEHLLLEAGYVVTMFDGLNLWYRRDDLPELHTPLSYPACPLDSFKRMRGAPASAPSPAELKKARDAQQAAERKAADAQRELARTKRSLSEIRSSPWWRMTRPARGVVHRLKRVARKRRPVAQVTPPAAPVQPAAPPAPVPAPVQLPTGTPDTVVLDRLRVVLAADGFTGDDLWAAARERLLGADRARWIWALHVVRTGALPDDLTVDNLLGLLDLEGPDGLLQELASLGQEIADDVWTRTAPLELVTIPVVDVTNTATLDLHTGIQRVVRETVPRWAAEHELELLVLDKQGRTFRRCSRVERARVLEWPPAPELHASPAPAPDRIVLPWQTLVVHPEIALLHNADLLRGIAVHSGSTFTSLVYDLTPFTRAENITTQLPLRFGRYMSAVKYSSRVSAISATVAAEFASYFGALAAQGLSAPDVRPQLLPVESRDPGGADLDKVHATLGLDPGLPLVLSVSVLAPRKNHLRTLEAAEHLWREGLKFQLVFIAGHDAGWQAFQTAVEHAQAKGRAVRTFAEVDEATLWAAYRLARCTVYVSLVEGFGLPAAESLSVGTPVVLTRYGSMAEVGAGGGTLPVDPRDVDDIAGALRTLLTDDTMHAELREAALNRPPTSWDAYARDTWAWLIEGTPPAP
jgi:FkbM family methyltransferase